MSTELSKTYDPTTVEAETYRVWMEENCFTADPSRVGEPYSIVIPPPNVTGALHLGHAINNTLQDILTRMHRMAGFNTVWIPGIDHAGIATQAVVERQLKEKENKTRHDVGRDGLVSRIWEWKQQYGDRILEQLKRMGCSCDWSRTRFTLDEMCARAVRETFFKLFKDGLVYRGKRLVNWDVHLQTSISDDEIYHETVKTSLWHIKYQIVTKNGSAAGSPKIREMLRNNAETNKERAAAGEPLLHVKPGLAYMTVATTRPETLLGDTAVAVHSQDRRWNWAIGYYCKLPLTDRLIPIIADDILVDPKFGSGVVKVTPAHDPNDYAVYTRHLNKRDAIALINILNPDGTLNANAGAYAGMKRDAARKKVVADLEAQGLLEKEEPYETQVGHSDRSKTPVEPYLSDQWFVKMAPLAEPALEVVRNGTIKFFPERHAQQYLSWLGEKRDWPISRQLWWGHRIPVWYRPRRLDQPLSSTDLAVLMTQLNQWRDEGKLSYQLLSDVEGISELEAADPNLAILYLCFRDDPQDPQILSFLQKYNLVQDPDVLDTWFSSALWPHSTLGWPGATADLAKWYPTSVLLTGRDIITLWVARMVMMGMYNMGATPPEAPGSAGGKPGRRPGLTEGIPFHHVAINPTILDGKGERMSKSKGNGVDPVDIIDTHGADALRFTLTSMATETQDVRMPVKKDAQGRNTSDKFDIGRNFCNKLWNAGRFVLANLEGGVLASASTGTATTGRGFMLADAWIISRFNLAVKETNDTLAVYRFDVYAKICYDFFWRDFCDWYVEAIKPAMKDPARARQTSDVLAAVLDGTLRLMHPMIPFITERLWWQLNEVRPERNLAPHVHAGLRVRRLVLAQWPVAGPTDELSEALFSKLQEIIVAIRNVRNEYKVDQKKPVIVSIATPGDFAVQIESNRELIELLAVCTLQQVQPALAMPANAARSMAADCEVFVHDMVNADAEKQRTAKACESLKQKATALRGRLSNASYAEKAPAHLVQQTRDELAKVEEEMTKLGCV